MDPACAVSRIRAMPQANGPVSVPMFFSANPSGCRRGMCMIGVLVLILLGISFFWTPTQRGYTSRDTYGASGAQAQNTAQQQQQTAAQAAAQASRQASARPFNDPAGALPTSSSSYAPLTNQTGQQRQNPQAPEEPQPATSGEKAPMMPTVPNSLAQAPKISAVGAGDGGWTLDSNTFAPSQDSEDYYKHFKPVSLESTMPMGWRAAQDPAKCSAGEEDLYSEFSRYAISPKQMKRAENMRSVLRLSELSRDGLSRTLGQRSLLRDFITPLGPSPLGDSAMLWNDSSVRQNYIAAAVGRFPEVAQSC